MKRVQTPSLLILATLIALSTGCNSSRYVMRDGETGIVAIPANTSSWPFYHRTKAEELMAEHFPAGYEVVREEETVVGQTTSFNEQHNDRHVEVHDGVEIGTASSTSSATTTDETEYRIFYRRR